MNVIATVPAITPATNRWISSFIDRCIELSSSPGPFRQLSGILMARLRMSAMGRKLTLAPAPSLPDLTNDNGATGKHGVGDLGSVVGEEHWRGPFCLSR